MKKSVLMLIACIMSFIAVQAQQMVTVHANYLQAGETQIVINDDNTACETNMEEFKEAPALFIYLIEDEDLSAPKMYAYADGTYGIKMGNFQAHFGIGASQSVAGEMPPSTADTNVWAEYNEALGNHKVKYTYGTDTEGNTYLIIIMADPTR